MQYARLRRLQTPIVIAVAALSLNAASCQVNPQAPELKLKARLYSTDSRTQSISRKASGKTETIKTSDTRFNQFICSPKAEVVAQIKEIGALSYQCEKWKDGGASLMETLKREETIHATIEE